MNELELHKNKLIKELPKLNMSNNARMVLHSVLKKICQSIHNDTKHKYDNYISLPNNIITTQPVTLNASDLRKLFDDSVPMNDILEHVFRTSYEAFYKTNIDLYGNKRKEMLETRIALFTMIQRDNNRKTISFTPSSSLTGYIKALKNFAQLGVDITEVKKLEGNYPLRGYEFILQNNYRDKNNNKLVDDNKRNIKLDYLKNFFGIPENYTISQIDNQVLKPTQKLINKYTKYNITGFNKLRLDPNNKRKITHYRIDVEYKEEYLQKLKEQQNDTSDLSMFDSYDYDNIFKEIHN